MAVDERLRCNEPSVMGSVGLLALRLLLAALFLFSGMAKLGFLGEAGAPHMFASAMGKFEVLHPDLIPMSTFVIPWLEIVAGGALLLGAMTRGAATLLTLLLVAFTGAMLTMIARGITDVECSCFGGMLSARLGRFGELIESQVGWTSIIRNLVLLALTLPVAAYGAGAISVDRAVCRDSANPPPRDEA